jgi:hypothetical protein
VGRQSVKPSRSIQLAIAPIEINLSKPLKRSVTTISNNKPVCSTTQPVGNTLTIIGADRDKKRAWFVVVRRDKPSVD